MEATDGQCPSQTRVVSSEILLRESKASSTSTRCIWVLALLPFSPYPIPGVSPHHAQYSLFTAYSSGPFPTHPFLGLATAFNIDGHFFLPRTPPSLYCWGTNSLFLLPPNHSIPITFPLSTSSHNFMWFPRALFKLLVLALPVSFPRWSHPSLGWGVLNTIATWKFPKTVPLTPGAYLQVSDISTWVSAVYRKVQNTAFVPLFSIPNL